MGKLKISDFLNYYAPHAVYTESAAAKPPVYQFGYVMGATGETATDALIERLSKECYPNEWESRKKRAEKWIGRRVYDCNGIAEGYIKDKTGKSANTLARLNYANWCSVKSPAAADKNLTGLPQLPGIAVFKGSTADSISHVGFLFHRFGGGHLDWMVLECRGVDYGLVVRPLRSVDWTHWGKMDKYFDYNVYDSWLPTFATTPTVEITAKSAPYDVIWLQERLNWIIGEGLTLDGLYGANTASAYKNYARRVGWTKPDGWTVGKTGIKWLAAGRLE